MKHRGDDSVVKHLIVGGGIAGVAAALKIRALDPDAGVDLVQDEDDFAYSRPSLFGVVAGKLTAAAIRRLPADWSERNRITLHHGRTAVRLDPGKRLVYVSQPAPSSPCASSSTPNGPTPADPPLALSYDRLLIATGAAGRRRSEEGDGTPSQDPIYVLRTLKDAGLIRGALEAVLKEERRDRPAVVLGGGPLACKMAETLSEMGLEVTMLVQSPHLLSRMLHDRAAALVEDRLTARGVTVRKNCPPTLEEGQRTGIVGRPGFVFAAKGIRPATEWLRGSELDLAPDGAVTVDGGQRTSLEHVYAAGDVSAGPDAVRSQPVTQANWINAVWQGKSAARAMVTGTTVSPGYTNWNVLVIGGCPIAAMGLTEPDAGDEVIERAHGAAYERFILRSGRLIGAQSVGDLEALGWMRSRLALERGPLTWATSSKARRLWLPAVGGALAKPSAGSWPNVGSL